MKLGPRYSENPFLPMIAALVIIVLAATASARNRLWIQDVSLWEDTARKAPGKARAWHVLGLAAFRGGSG